MIAVGAENTGQINRGYCSSASEQKRCVGHGLEITDCLLSPVKSEIKSCPLKTDRQRKVSEAEKGVRTECH
jgi:hypothetical protein